MFVTDGRNSCLCMNKFPSLANVAQGRFPFLSFSRVKGGTSVTV